MKKLTQREIKRLLSVGGTPEPPPGLADRIKAEIPGVLQVGGAGLSPEGVRGMPPRVPAFRPLWLLAASLLVVIGAGFVAVRFFAPTSDLARDIALGGVVRIEDIVVTVPERSTVERQRVLAAMSVPTRADTAARAEVPSPHTGDARGASGAPAGKANGTAASPPPAGSLALTISDGKGRLPGVTITATRAGGRGPDTRTVVSGTDGRAELRALPPGEYRVRTELQGFEATDTTVRVASGVEGRVDLEMPQERVAEEGSVTGAAPVVAVSAAVSATENRGAPKPSTGEPVKGSIVVVVHDTDGTPVAGATLLLVLSDRPDVNCGSRVTGGAGVATFCCVTPGAYTLCAQLPGFTAASQAGIVVSSGHQLRVELTMGRPLGDGTERPWTCPTPGSAGNP